jgi:DNA-directed RNA polymerase I, II, and III subunit RPABC1
MLKQNMWKTVFENTQLMMLNRGFIFNKQFDDHYFLFSNTNNDHVIIYFYDQEKLNIDAIKEFINELMKNNISHGIIIYKNIITSSCKKILMNLFKFDIELFYIKELLYDITKFKYYCIHDKLNEKESQKILQRYGAHLPILLKSDPISRYFYFQKNDIIKITRRNGTIAYRIVK